MKIWEEKQVRAKRLGAGGGAVGVEEEVGWSKEEERARAAAERDLMERLGGERGREREREREREKTRLKINLVPASPNGAANRF